MSTLNTPAHNVNLLMQSSQTLYEVKKNIATKENVVIDNLDIYAIKYDDDTYTPSDDVDIDKQLSHYITRNRSIQWVFIKEKGVYEGMSLVLIMKVNLKMSYIYIYCLLYTSDAADE